MAAKVDGNDTDTDVLVEVNDFGGVGDVFIGQLTDVKLVIFVTMPGSSMPSCKSSMV